MAFINLLNKRMRKSGGTELYNSTVAIIDATGGYFAIPLTYDGTKIEDSGTITGWAGFSQWGATDLKLPLFYEDTYSTDYEGKPWIETPDNGSVSYLLPSALLCVTGSLVNTDMSNVFFLASVMTGISSQLPEVLTKGKAYTFQHVQSSMPVVLLDDTDKKALAVFDFTLGESAQKRLLTYEYAVGEAYYTPFYGHFPDEVYDSCQDSTLFKGGTSGKSYPQPLLMETDVYTEDGWETATGAGGDMTAADFAQTLADNAGHALRLCLPQQMEINTWTLTPTA